MLRQGYEHAGSAARLQLFGGFRLLSGSMDVAVPVHGQRLLAFLGVRGQVPRQLVAGTLWPDVTEERAHGSLRSTMWRLNRSGVALVASQGDTLSLASSVQVDVHAFDAAANRVLRDGSAEADAVLDGGDLLPGWYDDWALAERERIRQIRMHALEVLAQRLTVRRHFGSALEAAMLSVRIEPLRESAHRAVVAVHLAEHNAIEAVRHFEAFRELLLAELDIEPSRQFAMMLERIAPRLVS